MAIDTNLEIKKGTNTTYEPIPEGTYQVQIVDVKQVQRQTKFGTKDKFQFNCAVVDGEYKGRLVFISPNISWFNGEGGKRPSSLFTLVKTIYKHYEPKVKVDEIETLTGEMINNLIGKQLIAIVKVLGEYNNVSDFLSIQKHIDYVNESDHANSNEAIDVDEVEI